MLYDMCMPAVLHMVFTSLNRITPLEVTKHIQLHWRENCLIRVSLVNKQLVVCLVSVGMKKLISNCPALGVRPEFRGIMNLKGLDVISTRLWLDQRLPTRFPANVLAGFEPGVGGTYFNLTELQVSLWFWQPQGLLSICYMAQPEGCSGWSMGSVQNGTP